MLLILPQAIIPLLTPFARLSQDRTWLKAPLLLVGGILAPSKGTVSWALTVMGLGDHKACAQYHQVLNQALWSPWQLSRVLLFLLLRHLGPKDAPLGFGIAETRARRRGQGIAARGIYPDGVPSSQSHFVKASGLGWLSRMCLAHIPWASRTGALPVLPSSPTMQWTEVTVNRYDGTVRSLHIASSGAVWYHPGRPVVPMRWVLIRGPLGGFAPQGLLCPELALAPLPIMEWSVRGGQLEGTFQGVGTQRQWSDLALGCTTPVLLGRFPWVTLAAHLLPAGQTLVRSAAW